MSLVPLSMVASPQCRFRFAGKVSVAPRTALRPQLPDGALSNPEPQSRPNGVGIPSDSGYGFVSPSSFASWLSSILAGRSLGRVQFLKRCGTTA